MKTRSIIMLLLMGAVLLVTFCLNKGCHPSAPDGDTEQVLSSKMKKSALDRNYQRANAFLKAHSDSLQKELLKTQDRLKIAVLRFRESQSSLLALAEKKEENIQEQLSDCDSLKQKVVVFSSMLDSTSNLYECDILQLEELVATKDSQIVICRSSYAELKDLTEEYSQREQKLTEDLQTAYQSQQRKIVQNKLLAGGFLMLSGITTTLYINSKH